MHVETTATNGTEVTLVINAVAEDLEPAKNAVLQKMSSTVKLPGFREGKAPLQLVEKNVDPTVLQSEFLDTALTELYARAVQQENIRPVTRPDVSIKKFVPFTTLEFEVKTHVIGPIKLGKRTGLKTTVVAKKVTSEDVANVLKSLQARMAEKKSVERAAKVGDEAVIDFKGVDAKGQPVNGAEGKEYPLTLGSNAFIPGFEDNVMGMKPGQEKTFTIKFPKDYGVKALAQKNVTFTVTVNTINELKEPALDDEFAAKIGPFKTVDELKDDIKKQLEHEAEQENHRAVQNDILQQIVAKTTVEIPKQLIDQQVQYELDSLRQNLAYRGQTYQEFLESEGLSEEEYKKTVVEPRAAEQVKTGIVMSEIAEIEKLEVTPEELDIQMQLMKAQYTDQAMQAELEKPEARRDIASRMLSERIANFLVQQNS